MGLFDFFSAGAQQQPQQPQQPQQQNQHQGNPGQMPPNSGAAGANTVTAPNGMVPPNAVNPAPQDTNQPPNPLDQFANVWKPQQNSLQPSFNADPAQIMEIAKQADFRNAVTPEQMQAVAQGGEQGVKAMMEMLNSVAQATYGQSASAAAALVQKAIEQERTNYAQQLPALIKRNTVNENLVTQNPALQHPAAQPLVSSLTNSLTKQYPNASAQDIQTMVGEYFNNLSQVFQPKQTVQAQDNGTDWEAFFKE